jgi:hypothetical protein
MAIDWEPTMRLNSFKTGAALLAALLFSASVIAEGPQESGFFEDYSGLEELADSPGVFVYAKPGYEEAVRDVTTIILPGPEIFISPDSKYQGLRADDMKVLADTMRSAMFVAFEDGYQIADNPGPNTLVVRMAVSNLKVHKRPKRLFQYLPPAYVATPLKRTLLDDVAKNLILSEAVLETESVDAETGEVLGQLHVPIGVYAVKTDLPEGVESWAELEVRMELTARRLRCRLDNARVAVEARVNCLEAISLSDGSKTH